MQTFLPYPSFELSVKVLDYKRLGKQRVEALQLLRGLDSPLTYGWRHHPAFKQWIGYKDALGLYMNVCIDEWVDRGFNNTIEKYTVVNIDMPPWIGYEKYHSSHRAALLYKNPSWYGQFGWTETPERNYYWPSHDTQWSAVKL